jgi:SAM-dependent methyltransferase
MIRTANDAFAASIDCVHPADELLRFLLHYFERDFLRGKSVLDAGCRTGELASVLAGMGAQATGVDLSSRCIATAAARYPSLAGRLHVGDIRNLAQFPDGSFDLVLCVGVMGYLPRADWMAALNELARVCKKDGTILVLFQKPKPWFVQAIVKIIDRVPLPFYLRVCCPLGAALLAPCSRWLLGEPVSRSVIKYRVMISLRGLEFGFPGELERWRVPTANCSIASENTTASFRIAKNEWKHRERASAC